MAKGTERLFLLAAGFKKEDGNAYYCPSCATVEGFLSFFPQLRDLIRVEYLPFPRPRHSVIELIGSDNQSLPVLVLDEGSEIPDPAFHAKTANGRYFIDSEAQIRQYLTARFGLPAAS